MANRHKKTSTTKTKPQGGNPNVIASAEDRPRVGKIVGDVEGKTSVGKIVGDVEGKTSVRRLDRLRRRTGGRVGADRAPLSSAAKCS